jgi:hypothetical protein
MGYNCGWCIWSRGLLRVLLMTRTGKSWIDVQTLNISETGKRAHRCERGGLRLGGVESFGRLDR